MEEELKNLRKSTKNESTKNESTKNGLQREKGASLEKYQKWAFLLFCITAIGWRVFHASKSSGFGLLFLELCFALTILSVGFFFICVCAWIAEKRGRRISPYRIFALVDIGIGLIVVTFAVLDIIKDEEWFSGLIGIFLLVFVVPILLLLLALDYIIYVLRK